MSITACSYPNSVPPRSPANVTAGSVMTVGDITPGGTTILALAAVDDGAFFLGLEGDGTTVRSVATFRGSDPDQHWEQVNTVTAPEQAGATVTGAGYWPDAAAEPLSTMSGEVGSDVIGVDIITQDGKTVQADVGHGRLIAAWKGSDLSSANSPADAVMLDLHLADGTRARMPHLDMAAG